MSYKRKKLVLFDFDGVLVNTLLPSFQELKIFNKGLTWEKFQSFSKGNFHDGMEKSIKEDNFIIPDGWVDIYNNKVIKTLRINDVFNNLIKEISAKYGLFIVSSSYNQSITDFLIKEKIDNYFDEILGADSHKSKEFKINKILKKYKVKPKDVIFITDSLGDILEANLCGINSIGVTWGIHSRKILEKGNPRVILDNPTQLKNTINSILGD